MSRRLNREPKRHTQRPSTRFGLWWPLWTIAGGVAIAGLTVVLMRYVG